MRGRTAQKRNHVCQFLCFQEEENGAAGTHSSMPQSNNGYCNYPQEGYLWHNLFQFKV